MIQYTEMSTLVEQDRVVFSLIWNMSAFKHVLSCD